MCPVCSLYLREGISLKNHLQTHSKDKVIEALLRQDPLNPNNAADNSNAPSSTNRDCTTISVAENHFYSLNRSTLSLLPSSSSYVQSNNQITTSQSLSYENQSLTNNYPTVNNPVSALNTCNQAVTYQQFYTNDGNVVWVPVYNVPNPVVVPNNNVVSNQYVNPCVMVSPNAVQTVGVVNTTLPDTSALNSTSVQTSCLNTVPTSTNEVNETVNSAELNANLESFDLTATDSADDEKETDNEVASILEVANEGDKNEHPDERRASCRSELDDDKSSCASLTFVNGTETESEMSPLFAPSEKAIGKTPSSASVRESTFSFVSDDDEWNLSDRENDAAEDLHSGELLTVQNGNSDCRPPAERQESPEPTDDKSDDDEAGNDLQIMPSTSKRNFNFALPNQDNATHILPDGPEEPIREKDHYILPNDDIPRCSSPAASSDYFAGLRNSFLTSVSLIASANRTMFADVDVYHKERSKTNIFGHIDNSNMKIEDRMISDLPRPVGGPFPNEARNQEDEDKEAENILQNSGDILESASSSRISPFNIQTDERMPARGELSGQESMSGTESSVWELQVKITILPYFVR